MAFSSFGDCNSPFGAATLGEQLARTEELQSADETNATFSHKNPSISSNSTRFLGSKLALFPYFWALLPDPETTSLGAIGEVGYGADATTVCICG